MNNKQIDAVIDRARRAYLRRFPEAPAPVIADSDIVFHGNKEVVELRDGDEVLAQYKLRANGELMFIETQH